MTTQKDVRDVIEVSDVKDIWQHLEKVFELDTKRYQEHFKSYVLAHSLEFTIGAAFVEFGSQAIEPILNEILQRDGAYPTWNNLLRFFLKEKLAESLEQRQYYRSGEWKSMKIDDHRPYAMGVSGGFLTM